jgi:UDP-3-O-[3-hydroxymyristoyl] N-acetylglucosamine deacetylase/3-hydroxyacyl-[acyl-carrier-protein] dehydratase
MKQRTIGKEVSYSGIGLHSGVVSTITFKPAPPNSGVRFIRKDIKNLPVIEADVDNVVEIFRGTTLGKNGVEVRTIEHVLAAVYGLELDNLTIELEGSEPPVGDGSSLLYVTLFEQAGIVEQDEEKRFYTLNTPVYYYAKEEDVYIIAFPSEETRITFTINYQHNMLKSQYISLDVNPETFKREICSARTFCFSHEVDFLKKKGLAKGGSLENAIVIDIDRIYAKDGLRFHNEFVRHKVLDLMGDLQLLGRQIKANIVAIKSGHRHNIGFLRHLKEVLGLKKYPLPAFKDKNIRVLDRTEIEKIIPHRYPFLFLDYVAISNNNVSSPGVHAIGYKYLSGEEEFFKGHFPQHPIMPGVLLVESMAQTACVLFLSRPELIGKLAYFVSIEDTKFRKPVIPPALLEFHIEVLRDRGRTGKIRGKAYSENTLVAESEFLFTLVERERKDNGENSPNSNNIS